MVEFCAFIWALVGICILFSIASALDGDVRARKQQRKRDSGTEG